MRRIFSIFFFVSTATVSAAAQTKTLAAINSQIKSLKAEKSIWTQYDKASNISKVLAYGADFGKDQDGANNLKAFNFGMTYFFVGNTATTAPDSFTTTFWATEKKPTFADSNALTITVNDENFNLGNARYARKNGDPREFLNFIIPRTVLEKIVRGHSAQIKIGRAQFKFTPEHIRLFRNFLAVSDPAR